MSVIESLRNAAEPVVDLAPRTCRLMGRVAGEGSLSFTHCLEFGVARAFKFWTQNT